MQTFGEQLTEARKAKGMTQEDLAAAVSVTRQTISSWERGRTLPDIDSARRLSEILGAGFSLPAEAASDIPASKTAPEAASEPVTGSAAEDPSENGQPVDAKGGRRINKWWIIACAAVLVCAIVLCVVFIPRKDKPADSGFDAEFYTQETEIDPDKAYFVFANKLWEEGGETQYNMYEIIMHEQNGVGFSVSRLDVQYEDKSGQKCPKMTLDKDSMIDAMVETEIPAYGTFSCKGGFPKGEFKRMGVAVYGTDANGNPMAFYSFIEF